MNNRNLSFGIFLLSLGILWALVNTGIIRWSVLGSFFTLWPLLLVLVGVNIIFRGHQIVKAVAWVAFLAVLVVYGYYHQSNFNSPFTAGSDKIIVTEKDNKETKSGQLRLDLGMTGINIGAGTSNILDASITDPQVKHTVNFRDDYKKVDIQFKKDEFTFFKGHKIRQDCRFDLSKKVLWDFDLNLGAIEGTIDMSELMVKSLDLDAGAGDLKLVFGDTYEATDVDIDAGVTRLEMVIPQSVGVKVDLDGGLNNNNLDQLNWEKQGKKVYLSPNYRQAKNKINIEADVGVGEFKVVWK